MGIFNGSISCCILLVSDEKYGIMSTKFMKLVYIGTETYIHLAVRESLAYVLQNSRQNIYISRVRALEDLLRAKETLLKRTLRVHSLQIGMVNFNMWHICFGVLRKLSSTCDPTINEWWVFDARMYLTIYLCMSFCKPYKWRCAHSGPITYEWVKESILI